MKNNSHEQSLTSQLHNDYKYITMILAERKPKTDVYAVMTKDNETELGIIKWYAPWRQYCFIPDDNTIYSRGCITDINDFIERLHTIRKQQNSASNEQMERNEI